MSAFEDCPTCGHDHSGGCGDYVSELKLRISQLETDLTIKTSTLENLSAAVLKTLEPSSSQKD